MSLEDRVKMVQDYTQDYFKTAKLLDIPYEKVRYICEAEE